MPSAHSCQAFCSQRPRYHFLLPAPPPPLPEPSPAPTLPLPRLPLPLKHRLPGASMSLSLQALPAGHVPSGPCLGQPGPPPSLSPPCAAVSSSVCERALAGLTPALTECQRHSTRPLSQSHGCAPLKGWEGQRPSCRACDLRHLAHSHGQSTAPGAQSAGPALAPTGRGQPSTQCLPWVIQPLPRAQVPPLRSSPVSYEQWRFYS